MSLVLIGPRGVGKTTVGRLVAARLGCAAVDTDELIVAAADRSIRAIFESDGEAVFRILEAEAVRLASQRRDCVISVGGGAVMRRANRRLLRRYGPVIWLHAEATTLAGRMAADDRTGDQRPALTRRDAFTEIAEIVRRRTPYYCGLADIRVNTDDQPAEAVAARVAEIAAGLRR